MPLTRRLILLAALVSVIAAIVLLPVPAANAQFAPADIRIGFADAFTTSEKPDELAVRVFFSLADANGKLVVDPKIAVANFAMLNASDGGPYKAEVNKAEGPIFITLVLDASGSMGRAGAALREAAIKLVDSGPQEALYSVIMFNDQLTPLTDFTNDKNRVFNAISQVVPRENAGTCLFDASFEALSRMAFVVKPSDRRAIIVMTDGVDEVQGGAPCSKHTLDDVTLLASNKKFRVPLYTIGFRSQTNRPIAELPLRTMAQITGGSVAIGDNLESLFKEINDALNAQLVAQAFTKPGAGERSAFLQIELDGGANMTPAAFTFTSPRDFSFKTPTPTLTFTPLPDVSYEISSVLFDESTKEYIVTLGSIVSASRIKEFRFQLVSEAGITRREKFENAPLAGEVRIAVPQEDAPQSFTVRVAALGEGRTLLFQTQTEVGWEPTETPTPTLLPTDVPVGAVIDSVAYTDPVKKDVILVKLRLSSPERIDRLRVTLINADTNVLVREIPAAQVGSEIQMNLDASQGVLAVPPAKYNVNVFAMSLDGRELTQSTFPFTHDRQFTPTPTNTFTPTPIVSIAVLLPSVEIDPTGANFIFSVETQNPQQIAAYRLQFVKSDTLELVTERRVVVPPHDRIQVPIDNLPGGTYVIRLRGFDANDEPVTGFTQIEGVTYTPPATPTPTPPPPTATPIPDDIIVRLGLALNNPEQRPFIIGGFAVLAGGLLLALFLLLRRPAKAKTGTGFLSEMTTGIDVSKMKELQRPPSGGAAPAAPPAAAPVKPQGRGPIQTADIDDKTSPVPQMMAPQAFLQVEASRDPVNIGRKVAISPLPFTLGRKNRALNFDQDDNVSRNHAEIIFEGTAFYIVDNNSTHGTFVEGRQVPGGQRQALYNGCEIRLGTTTIMRFSSGTGSLRSGPVDPDMTSPEMPGFNRR